VSVEIKKGEFAAIMVPESSGKSTLLNVIRVLDARTSMSIFVTYEDCPGKRQTG
jgi:ABC-type lipoprotein export system ATPase subunit